MNHVIAITLAGLGAAFLAVDALARPKNQPQPPFPRGKKMTPQQRAENMRQTLLLAKKLTDEFAPKVPLDLVAAIVSIESGFNPMVVNRSERAMRRGGAWGLAQVTLETAKDYARRFPEVGAKMWPMFDKTGESLKDPSTNLGFAIYYLDRALKMFDGDWLAAGTSYHQGKRKVKQLIDEYGAEWYNHLPPLGRRYYQLLASKRAAYAQQSSGIGAHITDKTGAGGIVCLPDPPAVKG